MGIYLIYFIRFVAGLQSKQEYFSFTTTAASIIVKGHWAEPMTIRSHMQGNYLGQGKSVRGYVCFIGL